MPLKKQHRKIILDHISKLFSTKSGELIQVLKLTFSITTEDGIMWDMTTKTGKRIRKEKKEINNDSYSK